MFRMIALLLVLALPHSAQAQPAPMPTKPAPKKPVAPKAGNAAEAAAQRGPCVGVVSHVGDFSVQRVGIMVFGNELNEVPIQGWGLDDVVVARVRAALGPRIAVRKIAYAKDSFAPYDHPEQTLFRNAEGDLKGVVQNIAHAAGCERYVAVVGFSSQFLDTNQRVKGVGIVNHGIPAMSATYLFAITGIRVYDGQTFAVLKSGHGLPAEDPFASLLFNPLHGGPYRTLKDFAWPPAPAAVMGLRDSARSLLAESLDKALPELLAQ